VTEGSLDFTTLGRGGSDTSAVALGLALRAERVEIFTDVEGVAVTDPRLVPGARVLRRISYAAMSEMARFGAGVLHPRSIGAAWNGRIPLAVRSTFSSGPGTLVDCGEDDAGIVGFTWLPAMETVALPPQAANETLRREWESRRLVMSVTDSGSGCLAAGAAADRAANSSLEETLASVDLVAVRREGLCAWLSLVGSCGALAEACPRVLAALAREDIAVRACEIGPRRCTVIVPAESGKRSARIAYDLVWPTAPVIPESALPNPES
jgi:aspartate kinase